VLVHFQLRRNRFKNRRHVFADAVLCGSATTADLHRFRQIPLVPMARQAGQIPLAFARLTDPITASG
jgi:hypothetical protein